MQARGSWRLAVPPVGRTRTPGSDRPGDGPLDFGSTDGQSFIPVLDVNGHVTRLDFSRPGLGAPQRLHRVRLSDEPHWDLTEYVGDYRSSELDITYSIDAEDDGLVARHLWSNRTTAKLSQVLPDRFEFSGDRLRQQLKMVLVFTRDLNDRISGLLLHTAGDRNIRFNRVEGSYPPIPESSTRARGTWG